MVDETAITGSELIAHWREACGRAERERDTWRRRWEDLESHRAECCMEMERERDELRARCERAEAALRGLFDVLHDYGPYMVNGCLRFQGDAQRTCENTGSEPCETCAARKALESAGSESRQEPCHGAGMDGKHCAHAYDGRGPCCVCGAVLKPSPEPEPARKVAKQLGIEPKPKSLDECGIAGPFEDDMKPEPGPASERPHDYDNRRAGYRDGFAAGLEEAARIAEDCYHGPGDHGCGHGRSIAAAIRAAAGKEG